MVMIKEELLNFLCITVLLHSNQFFTCTQFQLNPITGGGSTLITTFDQNIPKREALQMLVKGLRFLFR